MPAATSHAPPRVAPAWIYLLAWLAIAVGAISFASAVRMADPAPAWRALLVNFLFWVSVAQGAVIWSVVFRITRTSWSAPVNRIGHSAYAILPFFLIAFVGIIVGRHHLFPWLRLEMGNRAVWLNGPGLLLRDGIGLLAMILLSRIFVRTYLAADAGADPEHANHRLTMVGVALLFAYGIVFSLLGFDLVMSLVPTWRSELIGWYFALGGMYAGIAWLIVLTTLLRGWLDVKGLIGTTQLRYLGNLMLAFAMAMTYFMYSQALPIWYENLPHEVNWAIPRVHFQPWRSISWILIFTCYLGVFALLVIREMKEKPATLAGVALLVMASMWLERYMLVVPSLAPNAGLAPAALAALIGIGFLGLMVLTTARFLSRYPAASSLDLALEAERENWR